MFSTEVKLAIQRWYKTASMRPDRAERMQPTQLLIPIARAYEVWPEGPFRAPEKRLLCGFPVEFTDGGAVRAV